MTSTATIEEREEENDRGRMADCVYATCDESGDSVGPVWGIGDNSRKKALAMLSEICDCGANWHKENDE